MNIEITPKEGTGVDRHVQVSVPVETVRDAEDKAARRYASSVRLPGFRPGKAPAAMVRKKFADAIRQEALEALVRDAYKEVIEKQDLKVASQPHVHDLNFEDGKPLTFELHFELRPTINLARTSGFRVTGRKVAVSDEQVADQIEHLRAWIHGHAASRDLALESLIRAKQELLPRLSARVERPRYLGTAKRSIGEQPAVLARERNSLRHALVDDVHAQLREPVDVALAGAEITALDRVIKKAIDTVAIVLVILGGVYSALRRDAVRPPRRVLKAEALHVVAQLAHRCRCGSAGQS
jgi:hypothetical protein